jgi:hypothetical protein
MARTIVERIKAERSARKSAKEAVFGAREDSRERPAPVTAEGEDFLSIFTREVIPVIGETIAKEVSSSLDKVSLELVACLEKALPPGSSAPEGPRPQRLALFDEIEKRDTDLDMPAEEVVREIDRVLSEFGPVENKPILRPEVLSSAPTAVIPSDPPRLFAEGPQESGEFPEPGTPPLEAETAEMGAEAIPPDREEHETEALAFPVRGGGEAPPAAAGSPENPYFAGRAVSGPAGPPAVAAALPTPAQVLPELEASLASAIAEGISQFAEDVEKGQERIVDAIHRLKARVAALEGELKRVAERMEAISSLLMQAEQS